VSSAKEKKFVDGAKPLFRINMCVMEISVVRNEIKTYVRYSAPFGASTFRLWVYSCQNGRSRILRLSLRSKASDKQKSWLSFPAHAPEISECEPGAGSIMLVSRLCGGVRTCVVWTPYLKLR
jgi:hypothetical protein